MRTRAVPLLILCAACGDNTSVTTPSPDLRTAVIPDLSIPIDLVTPPDFTLPPDLYMAVCNDGVMNGSETDVDCGGTCSPCKDHQHCMVAGDCTSGVCTAQICQIPACGDGVLNGGESDVDCGGSATGCARCANGKMCTSGGDCQSLACSANQCVASSCTDTIKNGDETDVDCGGSCAKCNPGQTCKVANDCASGVCTGGKCVAAACTDGVRNGSETDVDCGGSCAAKCTFGKSCAIGGDCVFGVCTNKLCAAATCVDSVKNGTETDVDCGGNLCMGCATGKTCNAGADCLSLSCKSNQCQAATCSDGIKNGTETAIDCGGGGACSACANGLACKIGSDCISLVCTSGVCQAPTCSDQTLNGNETDVDCGGSCSGCAVGKKCKMPSDCLSMICGSGGTCASSPTGCAGAGDPLWTSVLAYIPCTSTIADASGKSAIVTYRNPTISASPSGAPGGASCSLGEAGSTGTANGFQVTMPSALGSGDYTVEFTIYQTAWNDPTDQQSEVLITSTTYPPGAGTFPTFFSHASTNHMQFIPGSGGQSVTDSGSALNTWESYAASRVSGTVYLFRNGTLISTASDSSNYGDKTFFVSHQMNGSYNAVMGSMGQIRVTAAGRYTGNYTMCSGSFATSN